MTKRIIEDNVDIEAELCKILIEKDLVLEWQKRFLETHQGQLYAQINTKLGLSSVLDQTEDDK